MSKKEEEKKKAQEEAQRTAPMDNSNPETSSSKPMIGGDFPLWKL
jgi:hypothetical protein